ncbi:MuDR family transposase [Perilla frutescens var. hirtella]|nr:MuDR family transposase [Perilla frutescens var. hirtella]
MTCSNCGALGHNKRSCKEVNPRTNQSTPNNEANATILTERRKRALARQGYGVRIFPSGNFLQGGARATSAVSQQIAHASASTQSDHGGNQVIDTTTPPPTI